MFVSPAYAQTAGGDGSGFGALLPLVLIFVVFYFLLIRPQQKKAKRHREMLGAIRRGDKVVTGGGIMGTVTKVTGDVELTVEIAKGVRVRVQRGLVASVLAKTEPAKSAAGGGKSADESGGQADGGGGGLADKGAGSLIKGLLGGKR